ncbi:MAG TPA: hypothetical protein VGC75_03440, partial [Candidatus Nitrosocosmicus sp.]
AKTFFLFVIQTADLNGFPRNSSGGQYVSSANVYNDKSLYVNNFLLHNYNIHLQYKFEKNVS